jgi:hypothetical protein
LKAGAPFLISITIRNFATFSQRAEASIRAARVVLNVHYYYYAGSAPVQRPLASLPNTLGVFGQRIELPRPGPLKPTLASARTRRCSSELHGP